MYTSIDDMVKWLQRIKDSGPLEKTIIEFGYADGVDENFYLLGSDEDAVDDNSALWWTVNELLTAKLIDIKKENTSDDEVFKEIYTVNANGDAFLNGTPEYRAYNIATTEWALAIKDMQHTSDRLSELFAITNNKNQKRIDALNAWVNSKDGGALF